MSDLILSRRDVDFLLFEWLDTEALLRRARFAGHERVGLDAVLDLYESLARDLFAPHNKKNDVEEPRFDGERVFVHPEIAPALVAFAEAGLYASGMPAAAGGLDLPGVVERAGMAFLLAANPATTGY